MPQPGHSRSNTQNGGIRVNTVSPGIIKTPMHGSAAFAQLDVLHPVGRMGEISDIVEAVLYLESAGFVTGEILHVDGGRARVTEQPQDTIPALSRSTPCQHSLRTNRLRTWWIGRALRCLTCSVRQFSF
ncbi:MAG: SDR family oxidoreductase [Acetobacteraceae bacterium]|nr:SDR family oxidoreductase [Acetobacteraceae bacterium]